MPVKMHFAGHWGCFQESNLWGSLQDKAASSFTNSRDAASLRLEDRLNAGLERNAGEAVSVPSSAECFH
jgi:hypothetical protein